MSREEEEGAYLEANEIGEEFEDLNDQPINSEDEMSDGEDLQEVEPNEDEPHIEIDMRNNSTSYFDKHTDSVYLVATHPTLPLVVSGAGDNIAYVWTTHSRPPKLAATLSGHTESVVAGGFSFDGNFLVTADMAGLIKLWAARKGGEKWEFIGESQEAEEIVWVKFHPAQPIFAAGASDGSVWVYEMNSSLENIAVLSIHSLPTNTGAFVETDNLDKLSLVTIGEDCGIICWDVFQQMSRYHLTPTRLKGEHPWVSLALSPSGKTFVAGAQDGFLAIIKVDDGAVVQTFDLSPANAADDSKSIEALAWSDKTMLIAVGDVEGRVQLLDTATWKVRVTLQLGDAVTGLQFIKGEPLLVASAMDGSLAVYNVLDGEKVWECLGHNDGVLGFALQNQGRRLISAGDEDICLVFDGQF